MIDQGIGFVGAGQMATALGSGFVAAKLVSPERIWAGDPQAEARDRFAAAVPGARVVADNREVIAAVKHVVLAVKPQQVTAVLTNLQPVIGGEHLVISICAGVPLVHLAARLAPTVRLVRVMPNTPCLIGRSASGYCLGPGANAADGRLVHELLSAVGLAFPLPENLLDAVTGLSGSGPAYVDLVIEALSDGGVLMGLPRDVATALAAQTVAGAAEMVLQTHTHPALLKERVTSPGGTTIAGLQVLEEGGVRAAMIAAVRAATRRSVELGARAGVARRAEKEK